MLIEWCGEEAATQKLLDFEEKRGKGLAGYDDRTVI
jgi:hypothetical protein